jgi:hypothetical protein
MKPKTSRQGEIIKIRAEINEIQAKKTIQRTNETKSWFFAKIKKTIKPLANMRKQRRIQTQLTKSKMKNGT